jgi:diaminohydroxyphosphoribosylaminopyrimidine deaminase/5-amino-6-(5-phosphoribosylamino)uracil reductase
MTKINHLYYMQRALQLAEQGRYTVSPNPMVGCVLVKNETVIGEGYHQCAGQAHAEIIALQSCREDTAGATAYVTLEPCCHYGLTPPCTDTLIRAGIQKVFVACQDPNPLVAGKGIEQLRAAGIEIECGLAQEDARQLNEIFFHYITTQRPFIIMKWAMSLDGKTITAENDSKQISGTAAQQKNHNWRARVDAILIGAQTARNDNPFLTTRLPEGTAARQPLRIIISHHGQLQQDSNIFDKNLPGKTLLVLTDTSSAKQWEAIGIETLLGPTTNSGDIDLKALLGILAKRGISSILVEGGETIRQQFFSENVVDKLEVFIAPVIISKLAHKRKVANLQVQMLDDDVYLSGKLGE